MLNIRTDEDSLFPRLLDFVLNLRRDMERGLASPNAFVTVARRRNLLDNLQIQRDVEFVPSDQQLPNILARRHPINRRSEAGSQKGVFQVLADNRVISAADSEDVHAAGDFAVGQSAPPAMARYQLRLNRRNGRIAA